MRIKLGCTAAAPAVAWLALLTAGCSGSPVSPGVVPVPVTLSAGNYTLKLDPGTAVAGSANFCMTGGLESPNTSVTIPVVVTQTGTGWSVRPTADADRGLIVSLSYASSAYTGSATGVAFDGTKTVTFGRTEAPAESVQLQGPPVAAGLISGYTSGRIDFVSTGGSSVCTSYAWMLLPR